MDKRLQGGPSHRRRLHAQLETCRSQELMSCLSCRTLGVKGHSWGQAQNDYPKWIDQLALLLIIRRHHQLHFKWGGPRSVPSLLVCTRARAHVHSLDFISVCDVGQCVRIPHTAGGVGCVCVCVCPCALHC